VCADLGGTANPQLPSCAHRYYRTEKAARGAADKMRADPKKALAFWYDHYDPRCPRG
jgi:hypothetical protein